MLSRQVALVFEPFPQAFFALVIFEIRSDHYPQARLDPDPLTPVLCIDMLTGMRHHVQLLLVEMGSCELFAHVGLKS
jgi:hypothetical protein